MVVACAHFVAHTSLRDGDHQSTPGEDSPPNDPDTSRPHVSGEIVEVLRMLSRIFLHASAFLILTRSLFFLPFLPPQGFSERPAI